MIWSRVGSLACFRRIAARCAFRSRWDISLATLLLLTEVFPLLVVAAILPLSLTMSGALTPVIRRRSGLRCDPEASLVIGEGTDPGPTTPAKPGGLIIGKRALTVVVLS